MLSLKFIPDAIFSPGLQRCLRESLTARRECKGNDCLNAHFVRFLIAMESGMEPSASSLKASS